MLDINKLSQTIGHCFLAITFLTITACGQGLSEQQMLDKAKDYLTEGDPKAAALELRNVLQINNENSEARFLLGNISLNIGDLATAEKEFNHATLAGWDEQQIQVALARIFIATGRPQKLLDEIENQNTWSLETRANVSALRALAEASINKPQPAKATLKKAKSYKADAFQVLKTTVLFQSSGLLDGNPARTLELALSLYADNAELLLLLANHNIQNKKYSAAADTYKKIISNEPPDLITATAHKARTELARLQIIENKADEAIATLSPVLKRNKDNPEANYLSGLISFKQGDFNRAENHLRKLLSKIPDHVQSHYLMGRIKYSLKEFEQASHHLSQYIKTVVDDVPARTLLTQTYIRLNKPEQALATLQPLLTHYPDEAVTLSLLSRIAFMKGELNEGIVALKKAIKSAPKNLELQKQLVKAYIASGKTEQALKALKTLKPLYDDTKEIQKLTISAYLITNKVKQALKVAGEMLETDPENAEIIALNGSLHAANNDLLQARKYFNKALQLQENLPSAIIGLARLEKTEGNLDSAIALYTKLVESGQGGSTPMLALSELAEQQKRTNDMLSWLEKARTVTPQDLKPRLILANYYLHNSQPGKAGIYIREALKTSPEHAKLLTMHSRILMAQKRYNEALPPLGELAQKYPDSITPRLLLGESFLRLGKIAEAHKYIRAALKAQPDNLSATILMAKIEFKAGNLGRSLAYAKSVQRAQPMLSSGYIQEGNVWLARQNYNKARSAYTEAWKRQQTADLAKKLLVTSKHIAPLEEAIKPLLSWLSQHPEDDATRSFLAFTYQSEKHNDKAIREYEKVLEHSPDNGAALNNLAWFYFLKDDPKALDMAERAYRSAPENPGIQDTYGWILTQHGQPEKGLRLIKQAMQTLPDNLDVRFHFADALIKSGDTTQGKQVLQELLNKNAPFEGRDRAKRLLQNTP